MRALRGMGAVAAGLTIDSSSYTVNANQKVTFTVVVTGPVQPTGRIDFRDGNTSIAGCSTVSLQNVAVGGAQLLGFMLVRHD